MKKMQKGSYTIEATIYVPMMMFMIIAVLKSGIGFYEQSRGRMLPKELADMDAVSEFYTYQILYDIGKEWMND